MGKETVHVWQNESGLFKRSFPEFYWNIWNGRKKYQITVRATAGGMSHVMGCLLWQDNSF
jgi:hypothetical protein